MDRFVHDGTTKVTSGINMCNLKESARKMIIWDFLCGYCPNFEYCPVEHQCYQADELERRLIEYENVYGNCPDERDE